MTTHGIFEPLLFAVLVALPLIEWRWNWPRYLHKLAAGVPGARMGHYRSLILEEWALTVCFLAAWAISGHPWAGLMVGHTSTEQLEVGLIFVCLLVALLYSQRIAILKRPETVERLRARLQYAEPLLPHTPAERRVFWLVSATAGVCEEVLYRGFMLWYIAQFAGPIAAILLSSGLFGLGHIYLGYAHVLRTAIFGLFLALIVYCSGSLWPVILLHAAMDWNSGELGFRMLTAKADSSSNATA
jgi:hypothetical protein